MAQEYTVKTWQPWVDKDTDDYVRDPHGNYKGSVSFEEHDEQVDATFKQQPKVGDKKYGTIEEYKTKAGKTRKTFRRADRPIAGSPADGSEDHRQATINAFAALKIAAIMGPGKNSEWTPESLYAQSKAVLMAAERLTAEKEPPKLVSPRAVEETFSNGEPIPDAPIKLDDIPF